jgi:urease accessory protein
MATTKLAKAGLAIAAWGALASPALAHHAMDGKVPTTFTEGLLSGLAHPVIGPDHLAFIIAIGIAAALVSGGVGIIGAFLAASTLGVLVHFGAWTLPLTEVLVASSVIAGGILVARGRDVDSAIWLALAAFAGIVHGYAFGESIVGADAGVLGAYLLGLAIISAAVATAIMVVTRNVAAPAMVGNARLRMAGAALGVVGMALLAVNFVA